MRQLLLLAMGNILAQLPAAGESTAQGDATTAAAPADGIWAALVQYEFHGNELWRFLLLLLVILLSLATSRIARYVIFRSAEKLTRWPERVLAQLFLQCLAKPVAVGVFGAGVFLARLTMRFSLEEGQPGFARQTYELWDKVGQAVLALAVAYLIFRLVDIVEHYLTRWTDHTETTLDDMLVPVIRKSLRVFVTVVAALFIADNILELKLGAVLATAGVGGLAIALAAKDTIANFFGSVNIFADRPFQVGERIRVGGFDGPVEEVGFRSTRIRTLDGHLVSAPNSKIANEMVENIGRRPFIKRVSNITITYDTPPDKVEQAIEIIKNILAGIEEINTDEELPPRIFFNDFNDCSLNILVIYWFKPPDYWLFQQTSQRVNLAILNQFNEAGIEFAFPTQTLYLNQTQATECTPPTTPPTNMN